MSPLRGLMRCQTSCKAVHKWRDRATKAPRCSPKYEPEQIKQRAFTGARRPQVRTLNDKPNEVEFAGELGATTFRWKYLTIKMASIAMTMDFPSPVAIWPMRARKRGDPSSSAGMSAWDAFDGQLILASKNLTHMSIMRICVQADAESRAAKRLPQAFERCSGT